MNSVTGGNTGTRRELLFFLFYDGTFWLIVKMHFVCESVWPDFFRFLYGESCKFLPIGSMFGINLVKRRGRERERDRDRDRER